MVPYTKYPIDKHRGNDLNAITYLYGTMGQVAILIQTNPFSYFSKGIYFCPTPKHALMANFWNGLL